eukprot:TRINITY_DN11971_c0_g1_i1.p2 TRINITY_DN11971_c0_g1~~TRINITY_DN11971_c0_g1_i1.p2  ORF type:complete len:101 (+),score=21.79 TRINITY_DN11971_c0_g1_i1:81-383(+)
MIRRPPRSTHCISSAASDVYKRQIESKYSHLLEAASNIQQAIDAIIDEQLEEIRVYVNSRVSNFSKINLVVIQPEPFEKTPTQKIKRYLYTLSQFSAIFF